MNKKLITHDIDIPTDDIECWERYPKHRWVYDLTRLLDAQGIKWSPFYQAQFPDKEAIIVLDSSTPIVQQTGYVYVKKPQSTCITTEAYIVRGDIKLMRHIDLKSHSINDSVIGEVELRISAFITLHFQKFTGVISIDSISKEIYRIRLKPQSEYALNSNTDILRLLKRIYKKTDLTLSGPTDQAHRELLAS